MGCAIGNSTLEWKRAYPKAEVHGIDVGSGLLRYARARAALLGMPLHFSQQNAERTRFDDDSFDLVFTSAVLHETSARALPRILAECFRVLRPGGVLVVNCIADQPELRGYLDNLCRAFGGRVWAVPTPPDDNLVVFALGAGVEEPTIEALRPRAADWRARLSLPFRRWVRDLRAVPHSSELRRVPPARRLPVLRPASRGAPAKAPRERTARGKP
jgi:SAM-dependent methyltransferase